jgi:hypothetical protein
VSTWDQRFTEPGALSSLAPVDFPPSALRLPRTAFGDDFDLLASRARCKKEPIGRGRGDARSLRTEHAQFANIAPSASSAASREGRNGTIGSPSRVRFRPPPPSTFRPQPCGFRVLPPVTTSTYSRPLLGANTTLDLDDPGCKGCRTGNRRNLRTSPFSLAAQHFVHGATRVGSSFRPTGGRSIRDQRFTEPGALSSTAPIDFPPSALRLPRTASGDDFDLLASRARCKKDSTGSARADARVAERENVRKLRHDFHTLRKRLGTSLWIGGEGSTEANLT